MILIILYSHYYRVGGPPKGYFQSFRGVVLECGQRALLASFEMGVPEASCLCPKPSYRV